VNFTKRHPGLSLIIVAIASIAVYAITILLTLPETPAFYDKGGVTAEVQAQLYEQMKPSWTELDYWTTQGRVGLALILAVGTLVVGLTWVLVSSSRVSDAESL
jgi:hypothetical protein